MDPFLDPQRRGSLMLGGVDTSKVGQLSLIDTLEPGVFQVPGKQASAFVVHTDDDYKTENTRCSDGKCLLFGTPIGSFRDPERERTRQIK